MLKIDWDLKRDYAYRIGPKYQALEHLYPITDCEGKLVAWVVDVEFARSLVSLSGNCNHYSVLGDK